MNFAKRFKQLREKRGWTQEETAEKLGVSRPAIAGYESEAKNRIPRNETLQKIAKLFNVSMGYLMGDEESKWEVYSRLTHEEKKVIDEMIDVLEKRRQK